MKTSFLFKAKLGVTFAALALIGSLGVAATLKEGDAFPDLAQYELEGKLPDLRGKVVLVDFFASWCGPCNESFPVMEELHKKFAGRGLIVVAINLDKNKEDMADFLKLHPASFVIVRDASNKLVRQIKIPTMPSSFLIDQNGKVHAFHRGFRGEETRRKYNEEIEALLK
jgi:cytochrome c biogenesis protein CcmG/thiol:disulfide interchange protein DsbE